MDAPLREGIDYYLENGLFVFTASYLLRRGYCCKSGCRHCPYAGDPASRGSDKPKSGEGARAKPAGTEPTSGSSA
jgi:hypothetical protein